jgi:hypothetical protein
VRVLIGIAAALVSEFEPAAERAGDAFEHVGAPGPVQGHAQFGVFLRTSRGRPGRPR